MIKDLLHFLLCQVLSALNIVLNYLVKPLPVWQVQLVRVAAVVSTIAAFIMGSIAPFLLLLLVSRPLPARGRWKFALATSCLFLIVGGIPLTWLQAHGLL